MVENLLFTKSMLNSLNLEFINTLKGVVVLLLDPSRADITPDIEDGLINIKATQLAVEYVKTKEGVTEIIEERFLAPPPDMEALGKCPEGSLGHCFAGYIQETGFDPNYYRPLPITNDTSYLLTRLRQTHDIWHLVTGFESDVIGELGLQAFCLAQIRIPLPIILLAGGLLKTLIQSPEELDRLLERIAVGYRMGAKAKPLIAQKWEENWHEPLHEIRERLDISIIGTSPYQP
jgi:ubiquinone biosynthesis protein Coq4